MKTLFSLRSVAVAGLLSLAASVSAQIITYTGTPQFVTLQPGTYDITVYGAQGGFSTLFGRAGGLGAEMEAVFTFQVPTTLTVLIGGVGADGGGSPRGPGGGGGGTFVAIGNEPLIVAGGGGGGGAGAVGANGLVTNGGSPGLGGSGGGAAGGGGFTTDGAPGFWGSGQGYSFLNGGTTAGGGYYGSSGGGYGGGGGGSNTQGGGGGGYTGGYASGGGGGSFIGQSAISVGVQLSGVASPDGSHNGFAAISAIPEPSTYALVVGLCAILGVFFHRKSGKTKPSAT